MPKLKHLEESHVFGIRLDPMTYEALRERASRNERSMSAEVRLVLNAALGVDHEQRGKVRKSA